MIAAPLLLSAGWMLVGTLVTDARAVAIIESASGAQQVMRVGDALSDCTIRSIARDEIGMSCAAGTSSLPLQGSSRPNHEAPASAGLEPEIFPLPEARFRRLLANRQNLAGQISLEPALQEGRLYGYRVAALLEGGELQAVGLAPGDVITHVNGAPASESGAFIQTIDALRGQTAFSLQIERDGAPLARHYLLVDTPPGLR